MFGYQTLERCFSGGRGGSNVCIISNYNTVSFTMNEYNLNNKLRYLWLLREREREREGSSSTEMAYNK